MAAEKKEFKKAVTAKKAAMSAVPMASVTGSATVVYYMIKWLFKIEIDADIIMNIMAILPVAVAAGARSVENVVRFYAKMKKIAKGE